MEAHTIKRNNQLKAATEADFIELREKKWQIYAAPKPVEIKVQENTFAFRPGLTFTPFANPVACNAHCRFCSEELQRKNMHLPTSKRFIKEYDAYFVGLEKAIVAVQNLQMGLSLSGLEATAEPVWLLKLLDTIEALAPVFQFDEKVLYTNGTGLVKYPHLITALQNNAFDRIELSRCHPVQAINQRVMCINRNEPIWENKHYETLVRDLQGKLFVKNSCILTKEGTHTIEDIELYVDWAGELGVKEIVLRELSQLDETYLPNATAQWIEQNRVPIDAVLQKIAPSVGKMRTNWQYIGSTVGYYYYNEHYLYKNDVKVTLETSSYPALMAANETKVVQKLVFHSNGNLCGDWDANEYIIGNFLAT